MIKIDTKIIKSSSKLTDDFKKDIEKDNWKLVDTKINIIKQNNKEVKIYENIFKKETVLNKIEYIIIDDINDNSNNIDFLNNYGKLGWIFIKVTKIVNEYNKYYKHLFYRQIIDNN